MMAPLPVKTHAHIMENIVLTSMTIVLSSHNHYMFTMIFITKQSHNHQTMQQALMTRVQI